MLWNVECALIAMYSWTVWSPIVPVVDSVLFVWYSECCSVC